MGTNNRARRKAKQKDRQASQQRPEQRPGEPYGFPGFEAQLHSKMQASVHDLSVGDEAGFATIVDQLTTGPDGERDLLVINTFVFEYLVTAVETAWQERGWQPAELHRLALRKGNAAQAALLVDAMAAAVRRYAEATVDDRWLGQLEALGAQAWWSREDTWLDEHARRHGLLRVEVVDAVLRVFGSVTLLPRLPMLLPPPGKARRGASSGPRREVDQRMLERVRGLLAKAESTTFDAEAETYTAKAQELMARHSIDAALLAQESGGDDEPMSRRVPVDNPYEAEKVLLLTLVAKANRSTAVWTQPLGHVTVFGFPADLDSVELLFTSLLVQATRAMTNAGRQRDAGGRSRTRSFRQSFLTGFAHRIGERLAQATQTATQEAVAELAAGGRRADLVPVLANREERAEAAMREAFPELVMKRGPRIGNADGFDSGVEAADRASLNIRDALPSRR
jgi:hypothetical protein